MILNYKTSEIQNDAGAERLSVGDRIPRADDYSRFCLVSPGRLLSSFSKTEWEADYSADFYRVLKTDLDGKESVEKIHYTWLRTPDGNTLCVDSPHRLEIYDIKNRELYIDYVKDE